MLRVPPDSGPRDQESNGIRFPVTVNSRQRSKIQHGNLKPKSTNGSLQKPLQPEGQDQKRSNRTLSHQILSKIGPSCMILMTVGGFVMGSIASVALAWDYRPQLSISPGPPLDDTRPFSVQFTVTNIGKASLKDIKIWCEANSIKNTRGSSISYIGVTVDSLSGRVIAPSEATTVTCPMELLFGGIIPLGREVSWADIVMHASFREESVPWHSEVRFRYVTKRDSSGNLRWFPRSLSE